jgi:hypothetical protein
MMQNWLVSKATARLSKDLNTEVSVKHVSFSLFNRFNIEGVMVKDLQKDTLLYAGKLKVRVSDWFFFKDRIELKYLGLEDVYIRQYRKDSIWNHQFLIDYFSGKPDTTNKPKSTNNKGGIQLDLQKIDFKNLHYVSNDLWIGAKMDISVASLQLEAKKIDLKTGFFHINTVELDKPVYAAYDFEGLRPPRQKKKKIRKPGEMYFNAGDIVFKVDSISIKNGTFINDVETEHEVYKHFDGQHLQFRKINGSISNFTFIKDTIKAKVLLATKERSGFEVKKLQANFRFTPTIMEFKRLDLQTNKSRLSDYYAMQFNEFNDDMADYIDKVVMDIDFKNSSIHTDDIAFFAPELKDLKHEATISGKAKGTVSNFKVSNLFLKTATNTFLNGDIAMKGLPDIEKTVIDFTSRNFQTSYKDALSFAPDIKTVTSPNLAALGNIQYKGNFKGTIRQFVTDGVFSTGLGGFSTTIAMKLPQKGAASYTARLVTRQFDLGAFLNEGALGLINFDGKVNGSGLALNDLKTTINGVFSRLDFNGYSYANVASNGTFQRKQYEGSLEIEDPNINLTSSLRIDLRNEQPKFNVLGDIGSSNFRKLNFTNDQFQLSGLFDLDFSGKNIDEFLGSAKIFNAVLLHDGVKLNFDSLSVQSRFENNKKILTAQSNNLNAEVSGEFTLLDLPNSFQAFLSRYYPSYIQAPKTTPKNQNFEFSIKTDDVSDYLRVTDKRLSGLNYALITGRVSTIDTIFSFVADVPDFGYDGYRLNAAKITGAGNMDKLQLSSNIELITIDDSTTFPNTTIEITSANDVSDVTLKTRASNTLNELDFNAKVYTLADGVRINFKPSSFVLNDKKWLLEKEGEIVILRNFVDAKNVRFTQGEQEIVVETEEEEGGNTSNLIVKLRNIILGDFMPLITKEPRMEGLASGQVILRDFFGKFNADAILVADQFRLDNDSVGLVNLTAAYSSVTGKVGFTVKSPNDNYNFTADGSYDTKDSLGTPLATNLNLVNTKINLLNRLLGGLFSDIKGLATGNISLNGDPESPQLLGKIKLKKAGLRVDYTKVYYEIDSAAFEFNDGVIDFGQFVINDTLGNRGIVKGKLYQRRFKNMSFDFDVNTNRLLLINTGSLDNNQFYGKVIGRASLTLKGPENNLRMAISGEPVDSSVISIPTSDSRESGDADFIVFKQYGTEMEKLASKSNLNLIVDLDLKANKLAQMNLILDELTGDVVKATGEGNLRIHAGTNDPLTMRGRYEIGNGSYVFNFQSFIKKPFELKEGVGNFIEWNGDPYNAEIHIDAQYRVENISLSSLAGDQFGSEIKNTKSDVFVLGEMRGKLSQPDINFKFKFPEDFKGGNDYTFAKFIERLENDKSEALKQATFLIVFNSFAPYEGASNNSSFASIGTDIGLRTISSLLTAQLNKTFSDLFYKIFKDPTLKFNFSSSFYNASITDGNINFNNATSNVRTQFNLGFAKSLLNDRVILSFGSDFDFSVSSAQISAAQANGFQFLPNVRIEFLLNKNGKVRLVGFYKDNLDLTVATGKRNRAGGSISFRTDFGPPYDDKKPKKGAKQTADAIKPEEEKDVVFKKQD